MQKQQRRIRQRIRDLAFLAGLNLYQVASLRHAPRFIRHWREYERKRSNDRFALRAVFAFTKR